MRSFWLFMISLIGTIQFGMANTSSLSRVEQIARAPGLIAFWDFQKTAGGAWTSYFDSQVVDKAFPVYLRKIGDTRDRAIDGDTFTNNTWVMMAMTFDSSSHQLTAYLNGIATTKKLTDPVAQDVFKYSTPLACNPFLYEWPIYSPRSFILKYNGYSGALTGVYEHWLQIDVDNLSVTYGKTAVSPAVDTANYQIQLDILRRGQSVLSAPMQFSAMAGKRISLLTTKPIESGDTVVTTLQSFKGGLWVNVGNRVQRPVSEGAPFTFGRALGLGADHIMAGSDLFVDGVAVFNRALSTDELRALSFEGVVSAKTQDIMDPVRLPDLKAVDLMGRRLSPKQLELMPSGIILIRP